VTIQSVCASKAFPCVDIHLDSLDSVVGHISSMAAPDILSWLGGSAFEFSPARPPGRPSDDNDDDADEEDEDEDEDEDDDDDDEEEEDDDEGDEEDDEDDVDEEGSYVDDELDVEEEDDDAPPGRRR
jgi:hypothetical protein